MANESISRRDILRSLAVGVTGSVLQVIPAEAAAYVHQMVHKEKAASPAGNYTPKYFSASQYATLIVLCDMIIPKDEKSGGALSWLDNFCTDRYSKVFLDCAPEQRKEVLDLIAFRKNAKQDPSLSQGVSFFAFLRNLTCDGYYTSKIGIADLGYIGNTSLREFPGCPSLPE